MDIPAELIRFLRTVEAEPDIDIGFTLFDFVTLPTLESRQAGYAFDAATGEPAEGWQAEWVLIADCHGDPLVYDQASGALYLMHHGAGLWEPQRAFNDLLQMKACLDALVVLYREAGDDFLTDDFAPRPDLSERADQLLRAQLEPECYNNVSRFLELEQS